MVPPRHGRWYNDGCATAFVMEILGERWSLLIVRELMLGPRRFNAVRAALPGLSAKTLTERLEALEAAGIVAVCLLPPPNSARAYGLTAWGQALEPVLEAMVRWAWKGTGADDDEEGGGVARGGWRWDSGLALTPVSLMLALGARIQVGRIEGLSLWVAFDIAEQRFAGRLLPTGLAIHPGGEALEAPDLRFCARSAADFLPVFFGGKDPGEEGGRLVMTGDPGLVRRFLGLFAAPEPGGDGELAGLGFG